MLKKNTFYIYISNIYLLLFIIYLSQGVLYSRGSVISQFVLLLIFFISIIFFLKLSFKKGSKDLFYKTWTALLVLNIIGFVFTSNFNNVNHINMFKGVLLNSLPFYSTFFLARNGYLNSKILIRFLLVIVPITVLRFQYNEQQVLMEMLSGNMNVVNNVSYSFVGLIPFVFLIKRQKILAISVMAILMYFIITGAKRGAMVSGGIGLVCFVYYQMKVIEGKNKIWGYFISLIGIITVLYFSYDMLLKNDYLIDRLQSMTEQGGSSGRDKIYEDIFNSWFYSDNILNLVFGYGFAASLELNRLGLFAHNDWLELLSNFGLLGVGIYMLLFYSTKKYIINNNWGIDKKIVILTVVLLWFFATLVSMSYSNTTGGLQAIILGYLIGNQKKNID